MHPWQASVLGPGQGTEEAAGAVSYSPVTYLPLVTVGAWICLIWPSEMASIWLFPGLQEAQRLQGLVPAAESKVKHCLAWAALL